MIVKNPHTEKIEIVVNGVSYSVDAGAQVSVPDDIAAHWQTVHAFIQVEPEVTEVKKVEPNVEKLVVTEEILKENPVLAEAGIKVGDVGVPATDEDMKKIPVALKTSTKKK